jgi:hypothetical protein
MRGEAAKVLTTEQLAALEVDTLVEADGTPAFVMMTPGAVKRSFGPPAKAEQRAGEIALASPESFLPRAPCSTELVRSPKFPSSSTVG